ncbi:uncharacterized protein LOC119662183 isoform X2 [Teleopsis dalmanni]|uniref:uncharacterized protein LOC119662144 isoform X2 n=1 Tax=Teleopsis dalmanni TaxID=139649 RepID=UPI0018CEF54C|nr:uncharacterized protein LOC119662144 isoform X2 [Teleopsis dalmanni]XP_037927678.1 uncharacterized protein LOC119662183 isoform X2 [Teleopsis dalmanni]
MRVGNDKKAHGNTDPKITTDVRQELLKIQNGTMKEEILDKNKGEKQEHEEEEIQKNQLDCDVENVNEDICKKNQTARTSVENDKKRYGKASQTPLINADERQKLLSINNGTIKKVIEGNKGEKQEEVKRNELDSGNRKDKILTPENKDKGGEDDKEINISDFFSYLPVLVK